VAAVPRLCKVSSSVSYMSCVSEWSELRASPQVRRPRTRRFIAHSRFPSSSTCEQCAVAVCVTSSGPSNAGPNTGAIAGGVVGAFVGLLAIIGVVIWYRRRQLQSTLLAKKRATVDTKDVVARAETVLNRPDPTEKPATQQEEQQRQQPARVSHSDSTTINLPPVAENPFSDQASINTASDRATNVIPIGYVAPSSSSALTSITDATNYTSRTPSSVAASTITPPARPVSTQTGQSGPIRPQRGPEIEDMRLDVTRPASEALSDLSDLSSLAPPKAPYAPSTFSGISGVSSRASTMSASSSILNEAPQIVTPMQANFRQVLGVQRAEVVQLSTSAPPSPGLSTRNSRATQATSARSPLARMAFSADDVEEETETKTVGNPFADPTLIRPGSSKSTSTFGSPIEDDSRPNSIISNNGTIIANIGNATRVQVHKPHTGRSNLLSTVSTLSVPLVSSPRSPDFRTAGQLSPPAQGVPRSFDDDPSRRMSQSTVATSHRTSTADSILEAFPFVPPSPISMHHTSNPSTPLTQRGFAAQQEQSDPSSLMLPPNRQMLGMSVMSATSTTSNGLGGYSFQFGALSPSLPPSPAPGVSQRASLDTLALSRDLEAFPLPYDSPASPRSSTPFVPK